MMSRSPKLTWASLLVRAAQATLALQELTTELTQQHDASRAFMKTLLTNVRTACPSAL